MTARDWLQKAKDEHFAIGAFNVANLETFKAIALAASVKKSPVIVESSPGETEFMWSENVMSLAKNYSKALNVPILVNLDHSLSLEGCRQAADAGYELIHFDGSKLPPEENLPILKQVVEIAHSRGLTAEGELDHIGGSSEIHSGAASDEASKVEKTDPEKAAWFVKESGIDIFAAFVGNVHGLYLGGEKHIDVELVKRIADASGAFLSLHGSSGIPDEQIMGAIQNGIVKVNMNSEMRKAYRDSMEQVLSDHKDEYAMYKIMPTVVEAVQKVVEQRIDVLGSANKV
jgi:fructose-bisphosphate aldolase, class II